MLEENTVYTETDINGVHYYSVYQPITYLSGTDIWACSMLASARRAIQGVVANNMNLLAGGRSGRCGLYECDFRSLWPARLRARSRYCRV